MYVSSTYAGGTEIYVTGGVTRARYLADARPEVATVWHVNSCIQSLTDTCSGLSEADRQPRSPVQTRNVAADALKVHISGGASVQEEADRELR